MSRRRECEFGRSASAVDVRAFDRGLDLGRDEVDASPVRACREIGRGCFFSRSATGMAAGSAFKGASTGAMTRGGGPAAAICEGRNRGVCAQSVRRCQETNDEESRMEIILDLLPRARQPAILYKLRLHYIYTSQDDKITSDPVLVLVGL